MRRRLGKLGIGSVCCCLAMLSLASGVAAQTPESEPVHITYGAVAACPGRDAFIAQVQARTSRARVTADGELGRTIAVSVQPTGRGFFGTLVVTTPSGETSERDVSAPSCDEVVEALALITALTIDPEANTKPYREVVAPAPAAPAMPPSAAAATPQPSPPAPAATAAPPAPTEQALPPTPRTAQPQASATEQPASATRLVVGGSGEVLVDSIAPHWVLAPRLFAELGSAPAELISPQVGLSVAAASTVVDAEVGEARMLWLTARTEGCPLNLTGNATVGLRPCVMLDAGILRGEGRDRPGARDLEKSDTATMGWLTAGMLLRLQVALAAFIELRAEGGLAANLLHQPSFVFYQGEGSVLVHEVPRWVPHFGLGVGLPLLL